MLYSLSKPNSLKPKKSSPRSFEKSPVINCSLLSAKLFSLKFSKPGRNKSLRKFDSLTRKSFNLSCCFITLSWINVYKSSGLSTPFSKRDNNKTSWGSLSRFLELVSVWSFNDLAMFPMYFSAIWAKVLIADGAAVSNPVCIAILATFRRSTQYWISWVYGSWFGNFEAASVSTSLICSISGCFICVWWTNCCVCICRIKEILKHILRISCISVMFSTYSLFNPESCSNVKSDLILDASPPVCCK